jgi:hypothetical protein
MKAKQIKTILCCRNPKDTAVSYYNHMKGIKSYEYDGKWSDWLPVYLQGKCKSYEQPLLKAAFPCWSRLLYFIYDCIKAQNNESLKYFHENLILCPRSDRHFGLVCIVLRRTTTVQGIWLWNRKDDLANLECSKVQSHIRRQNYLTCWVQRDIDYNYSDVFSYLLRSCMLKCGCNSYISTIKMI